MKFSLEISLAFLAFSNVNAFAVPPHSLWAGSFVDRSYRAHPVRSETSFLPVSFLAHGGFQRRTAQQQEQQQRKGGNGGLRIGGLTLGGPNGGISGNGLQLGGNQQQQQQQQQGEQKQGEQKQGEQRQGEQQQQAEQQQQQQQQQQKEGDQKQSEQQQQTNQELNNNSTLATLAKPSTSALACKPTTTKNPTALACQLPAAAETSSTATEPNRAEGEAAAQEAQREGQVAQADAAAQQQQQQPQEEKNSNAIKATEESERFSNEAGITLDKNGSAQNLGGNLGITRGSDGSTSVGGENGINIAT